jgi:hypothetical protein
VTKLDDCCPGEEVFGDPNGMHTHDCPVYLATVARIEANHRSEMRLRRPRLDEPQPPASGGVVETGPATDVVKQAKPFLQQCGPCDYGLVEMSCSCAGGDYRPAMIALVREVERLRRYGASALQLTYERGLAEGRRQATEGWELQWGVLFADVTDTQRFATEESARKLAGPYDDVMIRPVGPWRRAEPTPSEGEGNEDHAGIDTADRSEP